MKISIYIKYFLFLYLLAISSFEYFFRVNQMAIYLIFPLVTFGFFYYKKKFDLLVLVIISPFVLVYLLQTVLYGSPFYFAITLAIRLITIYFAVKLIGKDFLRIFINTIKIITISSLIIFLFQIVGGYSILISLSNKFTNLGMDTTILNRPNFIIYTVQLIEEGQIFVRNSGPFWEPGLFAVYLNIVLFLNLFIKKRIFENTNLLFILGIITTFSTTGIVALILNFSLFTFLNKSISLPARFVTITFLIISIPIIFSLPFMSEKIEDSYNKSDVSYSRFGAAVVHWNIIQDFPLTGLPSGEEIFARFYSKYADNISPNGITVMFTKYGILVGFFYYFLLYRTGRTIMQLFGEKNKGYAFFIILVIVLFSQTQGNSPIYWAIIFSQFPLADFKMKWERFKKVRLYNYYIQKSEIDATRI